jgi:hypothetical protein
MTSRNFLVALTLACISLAVVPCLECLAGLIFCPDCGKQVSERAVMCPGCGCPGDAIRTAAQSNQTTQAELPSFSHSLVRITSDQAAGVGVCIEANSQIYVLTTQSLLAGAQSLNLTRVLDGQSIPYTSIELANDSSLVRLSVNSTNLHPLAIRAADNADLALVHVATNNSVALRQTGSVNTRLPVGTPLLDATTNVIMIVGANDGKHADNVASVPSWVPVQPLAYRTQTTLLRLAANQTADPATVLKQLQETKWLTAFLAKQASDLIKELQQQRSNP